MQVLVEYALNVVNLWFCALQEKEQTVVTNFGVAQAIQLVGQSKETPNNKLHPTLHAVSICMKRK